MIIFDIYVPVEFCSNEKRDGIRKALKNILRTHFGYSKNLVAIFIPCVMEDEEYFPNPCVTVKYENEGIEEKAAECICNMIMSKTVMDIRGPEKVIFRRNKKHEEAKPKRR